MNQRNVKLASGAAVLASLLLLLRGDAATANKIEETQVLAEVTVRLDKEKYEVGEPIVATIALRNTGKDGFGVDDSSDVTGMLDGYGFQITDGMGKRILPDGAGGQSMHALGSSWRLKPGEVRNRELILNYHAPVLNPGTYSVCCTYKPFRSKEGTAITSPKVQFQIVETTPVELDLRISKLEAELRATKDVRKVVALLRFTGQPRAFKLLVDLLYAKDDSNAALASSQLRCFKREFLKKELRGPDKT